MIELECPVGVNFGYDYMERSQGCEYNSNDLCCMCCEKCQIDMFSLSKLIPWGLVNYKGVFNENDDYLLWLRKKVISQKIESLMYMMEYYGN